MKSSLSRVFPALIALTAASLVISQEPPPRVPTSVLLVTLDTTRADHLGCYGAISAQTPHLDALARAGVHFEQVISPAPLTLPSHISIMSGWVPRRHGVRDNSSFRLGKQPPLLAEILREHGYQTQAFVSSLVLDRITGIDRGFMHYDDSVRKGPRAAFNYKERAASQTNEAVLAALENLDGPFLLWVHYFDPHLPYVPPQPFREHFGERPYDGEIAFMDYNLGQLLAAVRKKAPSLLVVVAGDHGESLGEHGEAAHGIFIYQATQRVPLIIAGTGVSGRSKAITQQVGLVDIAPTVLELLELPPLPDADGQSLVPLLEGQPLKPRSYELESFYPLFAYGWSPLRAIVSQADKFILAPKREFYRIGKDPHEKSNLFSPENPRSRAMESQLLALTSEAYPGEDHLMGAPLDADLAERQRQLESLGYLAGSASRKRTGTIDPKQGVRWIADLEEGRRAYQTGRPAEGIKPLRRLLLRNPQNLPALLALGVCYLGNGEPLNAIKTARRALEIQPDDSLVHFNLANALAAAGQKSLLSQARTHYERALELNPRFVDATLNFASLLEREGEAPQALELLQQARSAGIHDPDIETRIAVFELKRGEIEAAKQAFRRALELNPTDPKPLEAMARICYRQGHFQQAANYYQTLLSVAPDPRIARTLGSILLYNLGNRTGAREAFVRALALTSPEDPQHRTLEELIAEIEYTQAPQ